MANGDRVDPFRNFNFRVEIDGITVRPAFSEVHRLRLDQRPGIEYREGTDRHDGAQAARARRSTTTSSLKWGLTDSRELYDWYADVTKGKIERKNGSIVLTDLDGTEKAALELLPGLADEVGRARLQRRRATTPRSRRSRSRTKGSERA